MVKRWLAEKEIMLNKTPKLKNWRNVRFLVLI